MEFISLFFTAFLSNFIIGHLLYAISGRNKKVAFIVFGLFFIFAMYDWLQVFMAGVPVQFLLLYFLARVGLTIMAFLVFARFTGVARLSFNTRKVKKMLPQKSFDVFSTNKNDIRNALFMAIGSLLVIASYFVIDPGFLLYLLMFLGILGVGLSVFLLFNLLKIKSEKVVLIIGKQKDRYFYNDVKKNDYRFRIKNYFKNADYIVDPIATVYFISRNQGIEKHHVFWIATNDEVPMKDEHFTPYPNLPYRDYMDLFKKYEFRQVTFKDTDKKELEMIKNQRVR